MNNKQLEEKVLKEMLSKEYDEDILLKYLSFCLALRDMYQSFHWGASSDNFYEDHLLFERLYNKLSQDADDIAEKFVGASSSNVVCPIKISAQRCEIYNNILEGFIISDGGKPMSYRGIYAEQAFLKISADFYDNLESSNLLTLGLDDLLTSIYSSHEDNIYLLKQRVISQDVGNMRSEEDIADEESENKEEEL
jgi:hypothetical protein